VAALQPSAALLQFVMKGGQNSYMYSILYVTALRHIFNTIQGGRWNPVSELHFKTRAPLRQQKRKSKIGSDQIWPNEFATSIYIVMTPFLTRSHCSTRISHSNSILGPQILHSRNFPLRVYQIRLREVAQPYPFPSFTPGHHIHLLRLFWNLEPPSTHMTPTRFKKKKTIGLISIIWHSFCLWTSLGNCPL
jgi:hypothetical protein